MSTQDRLDVKDGAKGDDSCACDELEGAETAGKGAQVAFFTWPLCIVRAIMKGRRLWEQAEFCPLTYLGNKGHVLHTWDRTTKSQGYFFHLNLASRRSVTCIPVADMFPPSETSILPRGLADHECV